MYNRLMASSESVAEIEEAKEAAVKGFVTTATESGDVRAAYLKSKGIDPNVAPITFGSPVVPKQGALPPDSNVPLA